MSAASLWPRAFGGGPLVGERIVRIVYMDESGTSAKEEIALFSAVMVDADKQWKAVERYLKQLADDVGPAERHPDFAFHATELYSGGKMWPREKYSMDHRLKILEHVVSLPAQLSLPVVAGYAKKKDDIADKKERKISAHVWAFMMTLIGVDEFLEKNCPGETAMVIAEDNEEVRKLLRTAQRLLRDSVAVENYFPDFMRKSLPLKHIIENVNFAQKTESSLLQLADASAFSYRRFLSDLPNSRRFMLAFLGYEEDAMHKFGPAKTNLGRHSFAFDRVDAAPA